ncbi:hypothetical protein ACOCJ4_11820 [Knoellia sp. CPCC 206435]|uniref:hypothetical protein n=1 Tax=Knoellia terrae TaxID=3404797 RepID=UPI003B439C23
MAPLRPQIGSLGWATGRPIAERGVMKELPESLTALLRTQSGVATRRQLLSHGVSKDAIRWNAGRTWRVVLPCTYVIESTLSSEHQRRMASLLCAGSSAALAGATAARLHGLGNAEEGGRIHVVVPGSQASRVRGFVSIRRSLLEDSAEVVRGGLRISSVARACVDAAVAERSARSRTALLVEAVQRNLTTVDELAEWCYRLRTRDVATVLPALETAGLGVWSVPEAEVLSLVDSSALLPEPFPTRGSSTPAGRRWSVPTCGSTMWRWR